MDFDLSEDQVALRDGARELLDGVSPPDAVRRVVDGGSGTAEAMALVRSGVITAIGGTHDPQWMGYAAMDAINRLLQGKPQVPEGVGVRAVDKSAVQSEAGPYRSPIDWISGYDKLWNQ